jgi:hypothetical protein
MNLGDLETGIDGCIDRDYGVVTAEEVDKGAEVGEHDDESMNE